MNRNRRRGFIALTLGVLTLATPLFVAAPPASASPLLQGGAVVQDAAALMKQADGQAAAGKYADAAATYNRAAVAYHAAGNADAEAKAYERSALMYEKVAGGGGNAPAPAPHRPAPAPQPRQNAQPPATRPATARIAAPAPRPGYIVGRAVYEYGQPLSKFHVYYSGFEKGKFFLSNSKVGGIPNVTGRIAGQNGQFAIKVPDGVYGSSGSVVVKYHDKWYQFEMWPEPRKYDYPNTGLQNLGKGLVHNYVWRLSGKKDAGIDNYYGCTINADCDAGIKGIGDSMLWQSEPKGSKVEVTLVPQGRLVDGSVGQTLVRTFDLNLTGKIYDVPMGAYSVSARVIEPNGTSKPLKISSSYAKFDPASGTSHMDWQTSIQILFPPSHTWGIDSTIPGGADPVDIFLGEQDAKSSSK